MRSGRGDTVTMGQAKVISSIAPSPPLADGRWKPAAVAAG